jgi:glucose-1-phosphate adenylyltransferase
MVSCGCIVSGSTIRRTLLFSKVRAAPICKIVEVVVLPDVNIGRHARLSRVVLDRGCRIPHGLVVGEDPAEDARRFHRTAGGVVLITHEILTALE